MTIKNIFMKDQFTNLYNQTGIPFQNWCFSTLEEINIYQAIPEFSFTHPPSSGSQIGKHSSIDILALRGIPDFDNSKTFEGLILLFIECKRADSTIKNWIFTKNPSRRIKHPTFFVKKIKKEGDQRLNFYSLESDIILQGYFDGLGYKKTQNLEYCLQGVEANKELTVVNRNQEKKIYKSLLQANHSLNALYSKSQFYPLKIDGLEFPKELKTPIKILFLPVVVTTANLYIANYNPKDVKTGEINEKDIKFGKERPWLTFEFPLPDYLKHSGNKRFMTSLSEEDIMLSVERSTTLIVNSEHWEEFLKDFDIWGL